MSVNEGNWVGPLRLSDEAGALRTERDELLRRVGRLTLDLERAERKAGKR